MAVTPANILSEPLGLLRTRLSESAAWQTWTGAASAAAALAFIHLVEAPAPANPDGYTSDELDTLSPCAVIDMPPDGGGMSMTRNAVNAFRPTGRMMLLFSDDVDSAQTAADAKLTFTNRVGEIIEQLWAANEGDALQIHNIDIVDGPFRSDPIGSVRDDTHSPSGEGDYHQVTFAIDWGFAG